MAWSGRTDKRAVETELEVFRTRSAPRLLLEQCGAKGLVVAMRTTLGSNSTGLSKLMVLLPLRRAHFVANCLDVDVSHSSSSMVSSRPTVLSVGWNWSLIFCQAAVEAKILAAVVQNACTMQCVKLSPVVAAYVDNVAVIGEIQPRVMDTIATVKKRL